MSSRSEEFVARAERCRHLAETTDDVPLKEQFIHLSEGFLEYAKHLETRERASSIRVRSFGQMS